VNNSYHFLDQWKFRLIIQKLNKTQLKLCVSAIQTLTAFITCSSTPKAVKWTPQKNKHMKMVQTFSLLWDSIPRSHKRERLRLLQNLGREERRKNVALSTLLLLIKCYIPTWSKQLPTVWHWKLLGFIQTRKDAAPNPPIQSRKNTAICVQE